MITYLYARPKLLFVGINPHFGSFKRCVPFSNNKLFWYLLSDAGLIREQRAELRDDASLKRLYETKFNAVYRLGLVNIINRPTRTISELKKGEEISCIIKNREATSRTFHWQGRLRTICGTKGLFFWLVKRHRHAENIRHALSFARRS